MKKTCLPLLRPKKLEKSSPVLFKINVRDYIPLTAGHGKEVERKQQLLGHILKSINDNSGNL